MKLSAKAISSPARTDKFPPPLMRFLRSNAGSRSRRSRSSPMFVLRNNNNNNKNTINESTQEPSSPKVTCMGQVRAKRSSKSKQTAVNRDRAPTTRCSCRCCCCWIRKPIPCNCRPIWPKWTFFRRKRKPTKLKEDFDSVKSDPNFPVKSLYEDEEDNIDNNSSNDGSGFASASISNSCCTPPRNALLLTRCRSAPYRSSSLASKFWGSPSEETEPPSLQRHSISGGGEEEEEAKMDPPKKLGFLEDSLRERIAASINNSEKNVEGTLLKLKGVLDSVEAARPVPVVLTRCKSEPARTGHRLIDPHEVNNNNYLWKKRRLGFVVDNNNNHCSPLHMLSD